MIEQEEKRRKRLQVPAAAAWLQEKLEGFNGKAVVFSYHRDVQAALAAELERRRTRFVQIDGTVPAELKQARHSKELNDPRNGGLASSNLFLPDLAKVIWKFFGNVIDLKGVPGNRLLSKLGGLAPPPVCSADMLRYRNQFI